MGPGALAQVLRSVNLGKHANLIAGMNPGDDAAVYRLSRQQALVQTVDFFPPVVDDPYIFGAVAAANAMSDIFAMGGTVLLALNIAAYPSNLPLQILAEIFQGGADKVQEAGGIVAGGHTVTDTEPKYGLCVTGRIDPRRLLTKGRAKPGDGLVLTKPLGTGVITTALKNAAVAEGDLDGAIQSMLRLNNVAGETAVRAGLKAATDITGFGLLGHAWEMCAASKVGMRIVADDVPLLPGSLLYAEAGWLPGGKERNQQYLLAGAGPDSPRLALAGSAPGAMVELFFDPETSGGLLLAVPPKKLAAFVERCAEQGQATWTIGEVIEEQTLHVV